MHAWVVGIGQRGIVYAVLINVREEYESMSERWRGRLEELEAWLGEGKETE